ncbi:MAG: phage minor capsid protein, partial [Ruminococcus sp.]
LVPVDIRQSPSMRQVLEAGYRKTLGHLDNLTRTTASAGQREYIEACNGAYMKLASGAFSYQEAVSSAVHNVAENGVRLVLYDSGHRDRLSVSVRRAVLTGLSQTCGEISRMNAEEMDCDLMEIDAHAGARPSHAVWQGKLVSLSGKNTGRIVDGIEVLSLSDIGYGTGAGFKGWNCSHDWFPYFEGYSTPNHTPEELEEMNARNIEWNGELHTRYEINQMQRRAEQNIRRLKRKLVTYDEAVKNAPDDSIKTAMQKKFQDSAVKLKAAEQKLSEFCRATGNDRDKFREQEIGFSRSQAQRAVWANKKSLTEWKSNDIIETTKDAAGNKVYIVKRTVVKNGPPNGITQRENSKGGIDRNYYDSNGDQIKQISNNDHGHKKESQFGKHGEHKHDYIKNEQGNLVHGEPKELSEIERKENQDIL